MRRAAAILAVLTLAAPAAAEACDAFSRGEVGAARFGAAPDRIAVGKVVSLSEASARVPGADSPDTARWVEARLYRIRTLEALLGGGAGRVWTAVYSAAGLGVQGLLMGGRLGPEEALHGIGELVIVQTFPGHIAVARDEPQGNELIAPEISNTGNCADGAWIFEASPENLRAAREAARAFREAAAAGAAPVDRFPRRPAAALMAPADDDDTDHADAPAAAPENPE